MKTLEQLCEELTDDIQNAYDQSVTMDEAEKLATRFLSAQMTLVSKLQKSDLDARMKKQGVKAMRGQVYGESASKGEKKPTEAAIASMIETNELVKAEQKQFDTAENNAEYVKNILGVCREAHIHFRTIAKGQFSG